MPLRSSCPPKRKFARLAVALLACASVWIATGPVRLAHAAEAWSLPRPDTTGNTGVYGSLALDSKGRPRIAYFNYDRLDLEYAERDSGRWKITAVDTTDDLYYDISLALDASGRPHIAYYNASKARLQYATRSGGTWTLENVDANVDAGNYLSLALDPAGAPGIAYFDATNFDLRFAHREGSYWYIETVDATGMVGSHCSLAYDASGIPHVSYRKIDTGDLKYATKLGSAWQTETVQSTNNVGYYSSIAVDAAGTVHIGFYDATAQRLRYARGSLGGWSLETVDDGPAGRFVSLALDAGGSPHMSYLLEPAVANGDLGYAVRDAGGWTRSVVDTTGDVGYTTALAIGPGNRPRIAYLDNTLVDLAYAELLPLGLTLNEFVVRPPRGRAEFFEVYNGTPDTVDWGGSQISAVRWDGLAPPHDFFFPPDHRKASGTFDAESTLGIPDFFHDAGGTVSLLDSAGSVLDRVGYGVGGGAPISCPLYIPAGGTPPPGFASGRLRLDSVTALAETTETSTGRSGPDTDNDAGDFALGKPTPNAANQAPAPDLGSSVRLNGAYVFPRNDDPDPVNESLQLTNPLGAMIEAGGDYVSDGFLVRPLFPPGAQLPMDPGEKYLVVQGVNGEISLELDEDDRLDLYETRAEGLVRVDQLGWLQVPPYFPDSALVRVPDGSGPSSGWDWNTSGGDVNLFYGAKAPFAPPPGSTGVSPAPWINLLEPPVPNPARGAVAFGFQIAGHAGNSAPAEIALYDARGRRVARPIAGRLEAGPHRVLWSPGAAGSARLPSGVYWLRLRVDGAPAGEARRLVWLSP